MNVKYFSRGVAHFWQRSSCKWHEKSSSAGYKHRWPPGALSRFAVLAKSLLYSDAHKALPVEIAIIHPHHLLLRLTGAAQRRNRSVAAVAEAARNRNINETNRVAFLL